ncbi:MAG: hypothetical protein JW871_06465 [Endomicrobiales bacterium]|nr:hypothetical protein [Endomicrobiales bacterium]
MKKILLFVFILAFSFITYTPVVSADDFADSALGKELVDIGLKFLSDPGDFFLNLHINNEDFSPLPKEKRGALRFNFLPTFLPFTWANLNAKVKILNERGYIPQIDAVGMYGDLLALRAAKSSMDDVEPTFNGYSIGAVISKSANDKTRIFGGFKYSTVNMNVKLSSSSAVDFGAFHLDSLDFRVADAFFFTGINHQSREDKYIVAQVGYGFKYKKITSRLLVSYKHFEYGLDIFPEGVFVFHPFVAWHWYF